jgi:hypothetical protein
MFKSALPETFLDNLKWKFLEIQFCLVLLPPLHVATWTESTLLSLLLARHLGHQLIVRPRPTGGWRLRGGPTKIGAAA